MWSPTHPFLCFWSEGALPGDLLYVSYANAPGGVLPYMLMLDRASKCVVLAVRGTGGRGTPVQCGSTIHEVWTQLVWGVLAVMGVGGEAQRPTVCLFCRALLLPIQASSG